MKELSKEEEKLIEQLQLRIDWTKEPFEREWYHEYSKTWKDMSLGIMNNTWQIGIIYRRKVVSQYIPWSYDDATDFIGLTVINKVGKINPLHSYTGLINGANTEVVRLSGSGCTYQMLFDHWERINGKPCGKLIQ